MDMNAFANNSSMDEILFEYHPAIGHIIEKHREELRSTLQWAADRLTDNPNETNVKVCIVDEGLASYKVQFQAGHYSLVYREAKIEFRPKRVSFDQPIPETVRASLFGKKIGEVVDIPCESVITKCLYAGSQTHLISEDDPALLDIQEFLSRDD